MRPSFTGFVLTLAVYATPALAQTDAQLRALAAAAEAFIVAEKCPTVRLNRGALILLLAAAGIDPQREPGRTLLERRIMAERFAWDTHPSQPRACDQPDLKRAGLISDR